MHRPDHWFSPDLLFLDGQLQPGLALKVSQSRVTEIRPADGIPGSATRIAGILTPGFIDLQVNGGGGVLLNQTPTPEGMAAILAAHRRFGTVAILPTLITDAPEVLDRAAEAALATRGQPGIAGLHIEGPHISVPRRGTHAERYVRPLDDRTMTVVRRLRDHGVTVLITLAPEAVTEGQIASLIGMGAVVSIGHSDTTAEQVRLALAEGASCFTHLFNAMSPLLHRSPGVVGAALNSHVAAGIICDGIHVADELVGLAIRARPAADLMFLVSDAMPTVGGPDHFRLYEMDLHLEGGRLVNSEGSLAGAHVTMAESVARLVSVVGIDLAQALRMAVTIPARVIGQPHLADVIGQRAEDIIVLDLQAGYRGSLPVGQGADLVV
jgi:N-acetylglucosamine-6-phosphate deacetylase